MSVAFRFFLVLAHVLAPDGRRTSPRETHRRGFPDDVRHPGPNSWRRRKYSSGRVHFVSGILAFRLETEVVIDRVALAHLRSSSERHSEERSSFGLGVAST